MDIIALRVVVCASEGMVVGAGENVWVEVITSGVDENGSKNTGVVDSVSKRIAADENGSKRVGVDITTTGVDVSTSEGTGVDISNSTST